MEVVQVVKRFGLCGGMEEYAYRLSNELCAIGVKVMVVCEEKLNDPKESNIETFELGKSLKKPRWLSHLLFAKKVRCWVMKNEDKNTIVHSHERIDCHNVSTIHSTLYNFPPKRKFPSLRNYCNEFIERRELNCASVKRIIPVSGVITDQISYKYSNSRHKLVSPIPPGVSPLNTKKKEFDPEVPIIGFMGKEWKRKGLPKAIETWRELRKETPSAKLCLAGFSTDTDIGLKEEELRFVKILGYVKSKETFFEQIDILIHPAQKEAFGMVIAESLSIGIPVLCSSETGASELLNPPKSSLSYDDPISAWHNELKKELLLLRNNLQHEAKLSSWRDVAEDYRTLYQQVFYGT